MASVHIGKKIKEILDKSPMSVVDFAKSIHLTRNGAYKVFEKETIDTGQLQVISKVLNHDFFIYYEESQIPKFEEKSPQYIFATKAELSEIKHAVFEINKMVERLEKMLSGKSNSVEKKSTKNHKNSALRK